MKICIKCNESKAITEFHRNHLALDGVNGYCIECGKLYMKEYRKQNKKRLTKYHKVKRNDVKTQYCIYYRSEGNYVGITNQIEYRQANHKHTLTPVSYVKTKLDALIVEAILHTDYQFEGKHRTHTPSHYSKLKQSHKRLAKRITQRIFTTLNK